MVARLRRFFDVRSGEGRPVLFTFLYIAVAVGSFLLAKPIRSGLFLQQFGASRLVYVYVGVALVLSALVPIYTWVAARIGQRAVITGSLLLLAGNVVAFWWGLTYHPAPWMSAAFYIWVNCYGVIAPVQAWTFAGHVFDTRQGRRLFGLVGSGASAGAIAGGLLARTLVGPLGTINLLLVLAALILLAAGIVNVAWSVRRRHDHGPTRRRPINFRETLSLIARTPYLRRIALLVALVAIVTQWTQFQFQAAAEQQFAASADALTRFFGNFNSIMGGVTLLVQIFLTGPALRKFGLAVTIMLLPLCLGTGVTMVWLSGALWAVMLTNGFDQGLRFSIDKATFELLYLPIAADIKTSVKTTIDLIVNRLADGVGGVLLGLATSGFSLVAFTVPGLGLGLRGVAGATLVLLGCWIAVALLLRRGYVDAIRDSISQHRIDAESSSARVLDRVATQVLTARLGASEPREVLYALDVFRLQHRGATHPAVRGLLSHPSPDVRRRAINALDATGDSSAAADIEALMNDADPGVRAEALLFLAHHGEIDPLQRITAFQDFPDYSIQAGLVAFLARESDWQNLEAARVILGQMIGADGSDPVRAKLEAARLLGQFQTGFDAELGALIDDEHPDVARAAIQSAGHPGHVAQIDRVLARLSDDACRDAAADALAGMGPDAVPILRGVLEDRRQPAAVRAEIPQVLAAIGGEEAQAAIVDNLFENDVALRARVIAGLNRLHVRHPELTVDRQALEMVLTAEIMGHYRSYQILGSLGPTFDSRDPIAQGLGNAIEQEQERIFRLLAPLQRDTDMKSVFLALHSQNLALRANALELLDNILSPQLRALVVPLFDGQVTLAERVQLANRLVGTSVETQEQAALAMLASEDAWLKACGVYAAGALRLGRLRHHVEKLTATADPLLRETARTALLRLDEGPEAVPRARRPAAGEGAAEPEAELGGTMGVG